MANYGREYDRNARPGRTHRPEYGSSRYGGYGMSSGMGGPGMGYGGEFQARRGRMREEGGWRGAGRTRGGGYPDVGWGEGYERGTRGRGMRHPYATEFEDWTGETGQRSRGGYGGQGMRGRGGRPGRGERGYTGRGRGGMSNQGLGGQGYGAREYGGQGRRGFGAGQQGFGGRGLAGRSGYGAEFYDVAAGWDLEGGYGPGYGAGMGTTSPETDWEYLEVWMVPGPHTGRGPQGQGRSDERIREDVHDRLTRHGQLDATGIRIQVDDGEVTLSGTVDNRRDKREAERTAETVTGVRDVQNQLKVTGREEEQTRSQGHGGSQAQQGGSRSRQGAQGREGTEAGENAREGNRGSQERTGTQGKSGTGGRSGMQARSTGSQSRSSTRGHSGTQSRAGSKSRSGTQNRTASRSTAENNQTETETGNPGE